MKYWRDKDGHVRDQDWQTDLLENVLVTAVEGGINYWADVRVVKSGVEYLVSVDGVDVDDFVEDVRRNDGYVLLCQALVWDGLVRLFEAGESEPVCFIDKSTWDFLSKVWEEKLYEELGGSK